MKDWFKMLDVANLGEPISNDSERVIEAYKELQRASKKYLDITVSIHKYTDREYELAKMALMNALGEIDE